MAPRNTRNKLKFQTERIIERLNDCQVHLKYMDELADEQSDYLNSQLPMLATIFEGMVQTVKLFRQGL